MTAALQIPVGYAPDLAELNRALLAVQAQSAILPIAVVPPPSGNAAVDTRHLQDALTRGGYVFTWPGDYALNATLTIYSDTTLVVGAGATLKMRNSAGGIPVLQNYAFSQRASPTTVTLTWSSGVTAAITGWTNHGCSVGDYVWLQGATLSVYNTLGYLSAADSAAGTATVILEYVPSGAVSGTITALKADRNITIIGGTFDYNYPSNTTVGSTLSSNIANLGIVQRLNIRNTKSINGKKYAWMIGACRDVSADGCEIQNNSDGIHFIGPAINCEVRNTFGQVGDDGVVFQPRVPSGFPLFVWTNGDVINPKVDGVDLDATLSGVGLVTLYPNATDRMIGVKVSRVSGTTVNGNGVKIAAEHTSADLLEDIEIDNVCVYADYQVHLGRTAANGCIVNHLRARNIQENSISTASLLYGSDANCAVRDGEVDISINRASYGNGGAQYHTQFAGTDAYRRFKVSGNVIGGSTGRGVQIQAAQTGNLISSITQRTGDQMIGGNAVSGTITLDGCDTSISNVISVSGVSGTVNINLQGNRFNNASGGVVRATSGTYNIRSAGDNDFQGTSVPAVAPSGTPTFNFYGWDLAIDPIAQGGIGATTGQFCTSTQATTEGGPAVLTPAGWVALGTGAAGINTVIT